MSSNTIITAQELETYIDFRNLYPCKVISTTRVKFKE